MARTAKKITLEETARVIKSIKYLNPEEKETLEILLDEEFSQEILQASERARSGDIVTFKDVVGRPQCGK